ncbi:8-oxoguanine DNA glycosylase OGG fold protein [Williamsia sp. SKLECPSW1]
MTGDHDSSAWAAGVDGFLRSAILSEAVRAESSLPNRVKPTAWEKHLGYMPGIRLTGTPGHDGRLRVTRDDLFEHAEAVRSSGSTQDLHSLFWTVMAWGINGNMRNVGRVSSFAAGSEKRFSTTLQGAAERSFAGDVAGAYLQFCDRGKTPHLGHAFFSKFLYFTGDRSSRSDRCFIYDDRVHVALNIVKGHQPQLNSRFYSEYSATVHRWSATASDIPRTDTSSDAIEFRLYLLGRMVGSQRNWLREEVAMLRNGEQPSFDDLLSHIVSNNK